MKSKKFLLILVSIIALTLILNVKSYAVGGETDGLEGTPAGTEQDDGQGEEETDEIEWPDFSNAKVEFEIDSSANVKIKISNIVINDNDFYYRWAISNTNANLNNVDGEFGELNGELIIPDLYLKNLYAKSDDMYLTVKLIHKKTQNEKNVIVAKKLNRLEQKSLGNRIKITITESSVNFSSNEPTGENRILNTKIGVVTDKDLLNSIGKNESGWRQKLLEYAKKSTSINEGTITGVSSSGYIKVDTNLNLTNRAYYFFYVEFDDENGKYIPIEDVEFCQAIVSSQTRKDYVIN